jgi:hypothetical protein
MVLIARKDSGWTDVLSRGASQRRKQNVGGSRVCPSSTYLEASPATFTFDEQPEDDDVSHECRNVYVTDVAFVTCARN